MANKDRNKSLDKQKKKAQELGSGINNMMGKLYTSTYMTTPKLGSDLVSLTGDIDDILDKVSNNNNATVGMPNISKLYMRTGALGKAQSDQGIINDVDSVFNDPALMDSIMSLYMSNKYLRDVDNEIDTVCKYMPRLMEALDAKKDNVLAADHFSKEFLSVKNKAVQNNNDTFNDKINQLKTKYNLETTIEDVYSDAAKYGEVFIYNVPYAKALTKLLTTKADTQVGKISVESGKVITEGFSSDKSNDQPSNYGIDLTNDKIAGKISVECNTSGMIRSVVEEYKMVQDKMQTINESALNHFEESTVTESGKSEKVKFDKTLISDNISVDGLDNVSQDGLTDINNPKGTHVNKDFPGAIVKLLDHTKVIPVYIEDLCLGYYYLEFRDDQEDALSFTNSLSDPMANMKNGSRLQVKAEQDKQNNMLRYISGQLSQFIDSKFINANQDLRQEIYMILKHNDLFNTNQANSIKVTFIPPEDMIHVHFNLNRTTHRGISDLERSLIPAKLYSCLYITNVLTILTRGQDKRVYYVRNQVDTNISKVLLNTINQIKKSNFGIRAVENINSILNITGRFNDYVIPLSPSGDAPVDFQVIQGQNVDVKTDLMEKLEEISINSTDVPIELIQARQSLDYAVQLTMSNSKFLRIVYKRQAKFQKFLSVFLTRLYNAEYNAQEELEVTLPPPMFLNIANTNQLINNTKEYVDSIVEFELSGEDDDKLKQIYRKDLIEYHLGANMNLNAHKDILARARVKAKVDENPETEQQEG